jgi:MFS family permease
VFSTSNLALFFLGAAFLSLIIFLPLFMVNVVGVSATRAGISLIPLSLGLVFGAVVSGQLVSAFGRYRLLMLVGASILFVGIFLLSRMGPDVPYSVWVRRCRCTRWRSRTPSTCGVSGRRPAHHSSSARSVGPSAQP